MNLTNEEVYKIALAKIPDFKAIDYRPLHDMYIPKGQGIVIYGAGGDTILYFPKEADHED